LSIKKVLVYQIGTIWVGIRYSKHILTCRHFRRATCHEKKKEKPEHHLIHKPLKMDEMV